MMNLCAVPVMFVAMVLTRIGYFMLSDDMKKVYKNEFYKASREFMHKQ